MLTAPSDPALAAAIAAEAGDLLLNLRDRTPASERGALGDRLANELILARLAAARPDDFVLSEELQDDGRRCAARRVWIVDPLDGTRGYAAGEDEWAVHIGLAIDGRPAAGAVALPMQRRVFSSDDPPALLPLPAQPRMVVSHTRCPALAHRVAERLGATIRPMGSAGAKAMAVVAGAADIYLHAGGQYEWDNCAPAAVSLAAGLHVSRIDGSALVYNCRDPLLPDLLICRREWAAPTLAAIAALTG